MFVHLGNRASRWFQMHTLEEAALPTDASPAGCLEWCKTCGIPVYMQEQFDIVPTSVKYPLNEIVGKFNRLYYRSTPSYMVALALYEGFEEIRVCGVDMSNGEEWGIEKPSMEYWLGRAEGMGAELWLPERCDLLKQYFLYGYEEQKQRDFVAKAKAKHKELEELAKQNMKNHYLFVGAADTWQVVLRELGG